jgi:hypothetical protein
MSQSPAIKRKHHILTLKRSNAKFAGFSLLFRSLSNGSMSTKPVARLGIDSVRIRPRCAFEHSFVGLLPSGSVIASDPRIGRGCGNHFKSENNEQFRANLRTSTASHSLSVAALYYRLLFIKNKKRVCLYLARQLKRRKHTHTAATASFALHTRASSNVHSESYPLHPGSATCLCVHHVIATLSLHLVQTRNRRSFRFKPISDRLRHNRFAVHFGFHRCKQSVDS